MSKVIDLTRSPTSQARRLASHGSILGKRSSSNDAAELQAQLVDAVANIPAERLREYITHAILEDRAVAEGLEKVLLSRSEGSSGARVQRFATCGKCQEEFNPAEYRERGECRYHDGELELDEESSTWYDWDEDCHGPMDSSENLKRYPEGFIWSCCERNGRTEGCVKDTHEASRKRVRLA